MVITCTPEEMEKTRRETTFYFFSKNNIIGFKSLADPLTIWEFHKIRGRTDLYIAENKLAAEDTIICAVCSSKPRKVLHESQNVVEFTMVEDRLRGVDVKDILRNFNVEDIIQNLNDEDIQKLQKLLNGK